MVRNKNKRLTFWTRLRNSPYESELVLPTQARKGGNVRKEQHAGRVEKEIHQVRVGWWMKCTPKVDWPLCVTICDLYNRSIEGGALFFQLRSWLMVAAGGSLHFGCQHPVPRRIQSREHPFRIAALNKKILARSTYIR